MDDKPPLKRAWSWSCETLIFGPNRISGTAEVVEFVYTGRLYQLLASGLKTTPERGADRVT